MSDYKFYIIPAYSWIVYHFYEIWWL